jgi:hypothetical protein
MTDPFFLSEWSQATNCKIGAINEVTVVIFLAT